MVEMAPARTLWRQCGGMASVWKHAPSLLCTALQHCPLPACPRLVPSGRGRVIETHLSLPLPSPAPVHWQDGAVHVPVHHEYHPHDAATQPLHPVLHTGTAPSPSSQHPHHQHVPGEDGHVVHFSSMRRTKSIGQNTGCVRAGWVSGGWVRRRNGARVDGWVGGRVGFSALHWALALALSPPLLNAVAVLLAQVPCGGCQ